MTTKSMDKDQRNPFKKGFSRFITKQFHKCYYNSRPKIWNNTYWLGRKIGKCPLDLWTYQEMIYEIRPDLIIESGTGEEAGSTCFFASCCELIGKGKVVTIDISDPADKPKHQRITYLKGSSVSREIVDKVRQLARNQKSILIFLDSDHSKKHVLEELRIYSKLVTPDSYIVVEDTNVGGHPVKKGHWPGPMEAVMEFLSDDKDFFIDKAREKFMLSFNPNGYLRKKSTSP